MAKKTNERQAKILNKSIDKIKESLDIMKGYLETGKVESFKTYAESFQKDYIERQSILKGIETLEKFANEILSRIDSFRAKDEQAKQYEESMCQNALKTIIAKSKMGNEYNNGFPYDIIDFYADFGKYPFMNRMALYKKASKLKREDNIAVNQVIGFSCQISEPLETSVEVLIQEPYTIIIRADGIEVSHSFTYEEKKDAIMYMVGNHVPLCKEYFYRVLKKILLGAIKTEEPKVNVLSK